MGGPNAVEGNYIVDSEVGAGYLGHAENGRRVLLIPVTDGRVPLDRTTGDIVIMFRPSVHFALGKRSFDSSAAVIECANNELDATFAVLANDVALSLKQLDVRPSSREVSQALSRWEELLRASRILTKDEEIGLWGELWMLTQLPNVARGIAAWRGPDAELVDFVGSGIGIECKTSFRRLQHFVSQEQVGRPLGDLKVYLQSIWIDVDEFHGTSVNDLIRALDDDLAERRSFEDKLLSTGYSRADAHRYLLKLRVLEPPKLFPSESIPRVRDFDEGVSRIRYLASLQEDQAIPPSEALAVAMRLCG